MVRNGSYFRGLFKPNDTDYINFQTTGKNNASSSKMITLTGGVVDYDEGLKIQISELCNDGDELFQPWIIEFETKEKINLYNLIETDKYTYIEFVYRNESYYGYIIEVTSKPSIRATAKFKLIATQSTDITQLIR